MRQVISTSVSNFIYTFFNCSYNPEQYGSVGWTLLHKAKVTGSIPGQGTYMSGLWAQCQVGAYARGDRLMFLSLSLSLLFLFTNSKKYKSFKNI